MSENMVIIKGEAYVKVGNRLFKLGGVSVPPNSIDMTAFETDGIIKEYYGDTEKITTMEFDADGNPVKITDGDGRVTVLTW